MEDVDMEDDQHREDGEHGPRAVPNLRPRGWRLEIEFNAGELNADHKDCSGPTSPSVLGPRWRTP